MLAFLQTLPKDVLIAGTPCALDNVPLFAKRQVLFSCEHISADDDLMRAALAAYYAEDHETVLRFCQVHAIDYLVINRHSCSEAYIGAGAIFFEPYNHELLPKVRARSTFALARVPSNATIFEAGDLFVIPCTASSFSRQSRMAFFPTEWTGEARICDKKMHLQYHSRKPGHK